HPPGGTGGEFTAVAHRAVPPHGSSDPIGIHVHTFHPGTIQLLARDVAALQLEGPGTEAIGAGEVAGQLGHGVLAHQIADDAVGGDVLAGEHLAAKQAQAEAFAPVAEEVRLDAVGDLEVHALHYGLVLVEEAAKDTGNDACAVTLDVGAEFRHTLETAIHHVLL